MDRRSCRIPATSRTRDRRSERRPAGNQEGPTGGRPPRPGPRPRAPPPCPRPPPGPQRSPCPAMATASAPATAPAPSAGGVPPLLRLTVAPARRVGVEELHADATEHQARGDEDRKSTRLNSSHVKSSYAVSCLKKKRENNRGGNPE